MKISPVNGERVLFCKHADVGDDHIDISAKACPDQPFHWYYLGDDNRVRKQGGEEFALRFVAICNACERTGNTPLLSDKFEGRDAVWFGGPINITSPHDSN